MNHDTKKQLCCYCGVRKATTRDHIPPKSIFNKPRPHDLITVPCCFGCNNEASASDEKFKAYLGMHVARQGGEAERLFKEGVLPTTTHNNQLRGKILNSMYPININTKDPTAIQKAIAVPWDNDVHELTIERITKGLFFYHYKKIVPPNVEIKTYWFNKPPANFNDQLYFKSIANGLFVYQYNKVSEAEFDSIWFFTFYGAHFAGSIILPLNKKIEI